MRIVLTGGPCGGKTTFINLCLKRYPKKITVVPEAATIVYGGGFPRKNDDFGQRCVQRAIYFIQVELEQLLEHHHPEHLLICDRGSLDGLAYWPGGETKDYLDDVGSDLKTELHRYEWVIHFETAGVDSYDHSNPYRIETYEEALQLEQKIKQAWLPHPRRLVIPSNGDFLKKMEQGLTTLELILAGENHTSIVQKLRSQFPVK